MMYPEDALPTWEVKASRRRGSSKHWVTMVFDDFVKAIMFYDNLKSKGYTTTIEEVWNNGKSGN